MQEQTIYIIGHRHPDTDSVMSAVALADLKGRSGMHCVPCRLGKLNAESRWLLDKFGLEVPEKLKDARWTLGEIELDEARTIGLEDSIFDALKVMEECGRYSLAVADEDGQLRGIVTSRNLAEVGLRDTAMGIELLRQTSIEAICRTVDGKMLVRPEHAHLNGKVSIVAITKDGGRRYEVKDRIVIAGDDEECQIRLIEKGAGMLLLVWTESISERVYRLAEEHGCAVILSGYGSMNTSRYLYFAPPVRLVMKEEVKAFRMSDLAGDVLVRMRRDRFRSYPVLDKRGRVVGFVERYHLLQAQPRRLVLVDHNEFSQSVRGIEQAQVLEVVDHHRVSGFSTARPVRMRCETVGSTATIVSKMYRERMVEIPRSIAGILLGAILSDTLHFSSPTTTQEDIFMAGSLARILNVDLDQFAREMFSVSADITNLSDEQVLMQDCKEFDISEQKWLVAQSIVYGLDQVSERENGLQNAVDALARRENCCVLLAMTSIGQRGSRLFVSEDGGQACRLAFPNGDVLEEGLLSRKSQIIPRLTECVQDLA